MEFKSEPGNGGGSRAFLKLEDQRSVKGVFKGSVHEFYSVWKDGRAQVCSPEIPGATFRFRINFVFKENGVLVSKIWEQGTMTYNMLKEIHDEFNLEKTIVKITRNGTGKNTIYTIMPLKDILTKDLEKQIGSVALQELEHKVSNGENSHEIKPFDSNEEIPF